MTTGIHRGTESAGSAVALAAEKPVARILLIEDNEEEMQLVLCCLDEYGHGRYEMEWASHLPEGVERLANGGIDVILLDLGLAECEGAASYLAVRETAPEVPTIILTADDREATEQLVMNYGADHYLIKDEVSGLQLLRAIRGAMFRRKARAIAPGALASPTATPARQG